MVAVACVRCGAPSAPGARFCGVCGFALPVVAPAGPAGAPPTYPLPAPPWVLVPPRTAALSVEVDAPVVSHLQVAAVIGLIGAGLGLFIGFGLGPVFHVDLMAGLTTGVGTVVTFLYDLELLVLVSVALSITSLYFLRLAFARVAPVDEEFRTPSTFALVGIAGFVVLFLGLLVLVQALVVLLNCAGTTRPVPTSCVDLGPLFEGIGVVLLGAVLALIGLVGIAVGIWRLGTRYDEELLHVGAVLWVLVPLAGQLLVLYAAYKVHQRLGRPGPPATLQSLGY